MRQLLVAILGIVLLVGVAGAAPEKSLLRVDERFRDAPGKDRYPQAKALVLIDHIEFELEPDGSTLFREHDVIKVLDQKGIAEHDQLNRIYHAKSEQVEVVELRTISPQGVVTEVPKESILDQPVASSSELYQDYRRLKVSFPELKEGWLVEFRLVTRRKPRPGGAWWATTYVQNPDPILWSTFTVRLPQGTKMNWATPGLGRMTPKTSQEGERDIYFWEVKNQTALEPEPAMPGVLGLLNRIEISSFESWSEVGSWLDQGWSASTQPGQRVSLKTAGLLPTAATSAAKVDAILEWLEKEKEPVAFLTDDFFPRDLSIALDEKILANLDVAALAASMLRFAGFQVEAVVTFAKPADELASDLPMPSKVEEYLLRVSDTSRDVYWIHPEHPGEFHTHTPSGFQGMGAMLLGDNQLVDLKGDEPDRNRQEVRVEARVDRNGRTEIGLWIEQFGESGAPWREAARTLAAVNRRERERNLDNLFARLARSISPRARVHDRYFDLDPESGQQFDMSATLIVPGYVVKEGREFQLPLPIQANERLRQLLGRGLNRLYPVRFDHPFRDETRVHVLLPEGSKVTSLPEPVSIDTPAASFVSRIRVEEGETWYYSRLTVKKPWVPLEELEPLLKVARKMAESQQSVLKFTSPTATIFSDDD